MSDSQDAEIWEPAEEPSEREAWPLRPLLLAALGAVTGWLIWFIAGDQHELPDLPTLRLAAVAGLGIGAGMLGFTLERRDWILSLAFSIAAGLVATGIVWWSGSPGSEGGADAWRLVSLFLALAIAAPLFQAARDSRAIRFPYPLAYDHAWTNVVLWCACWAFVGISVLLLVLLSELFSLIKLLFLRDLMREPWFMATLIGLAFGAALGVFREQDGVVRLLQRVVAAVLAVLAPVLALGLAVFLLALPFTGLAPLWESWIDATPLLLVCVVGSLILANVVIGKNSEQEFRAAPFRIGAMVLAVVMLPLAILAAVATGLRIDQYGFTPERLWAATFVVIACAFGLAYWYSLGRGRMEWANHARPANRALVFGVCAIALLLATPLVSFNAISANDQVARLESGRVSPDKFDWRALAFDFGEPGKAAIKSLQASANAKIRAEASQAAKAKTPWDLDDPEAAVTQFTGRFEVKPAGAVLPDSLKTKILEGYFTCTGKAVCRVFMHADQRSAVVLGDGCASLPAEQQVAPGVDCGIHTMPFVLEASGWREAAFVNSTPVKMTPEQEKESLRRERDAIERGDVTIRTVQRRQAFIGDKPINGLFE